ncbi:MAG: hypothetical protein RLZZ456_1399 [Pseudomonadota bacterium]|jgi:hypothetical protein
MNTAASERYLLCRPEGGFNDMLCQIELCWHYAEANGRTLIVDSAVTGFGDDFATYLRPADGQHAKKQLGPKFDLKAFHDVVLTGGSMPMALLERRVQQWIDKQK